MASPPPPSRVATPPLMAPVPLDTPRFTDLGKENLLHPTLLKTITEDLKFDHSKPYVHVRLFFFSLLGAESLEAVPRILILLPELLRQLRKI
jgi:hypothetical protein